MNRRNFIGILGGSIAANSFVGNNEFILGHNQKRYRLNKTWGQLSPERFPVKDCHEMVIDKSGRIFLLTNDTHNNILIYDRSGKLLDSWGKDYPGAHGLSIHDENGEEYIYICDNELHQVIKTDLKGRVIMRLAYPMEAGLYKTETEYIPTETAITSNGDIYVADGYGKDYIHRYNRKGQYLGHFGGRGNGIENLRNAHGICIDDRDRANPGLIVSSREQNAFKVYSLDGNYRSTIAVPGAWVCRPVIKGEYLYAAVLQSSSALWQGSGFITILNKENQVVSNPGGTAPEYHQNKLEELRQSADRSFIYPHDVCIDGDENIYVAQWNSGKTYPYKLSPV